MNETNYNYLRLELEMVNFDLCRGINIDALEKS